MAEVRTGRGWSREELAERLARLAGMPRSCPAVPLDELRADQGWRREHSEACIAREPPGLPREGGAFERACEALATYAFSDPTIVEAHFDPRVPLAGRRMLLEIQVLGLHYLCGVVVTDVCCERDRTRSAFGFRYDTLEGHVERGAEWFVVEQDHATGIVRLVITSRWQAGELREWWTRLGFGLLAPRYRGWWLRRAHARMIALLHEPHRVLAPERARLVDEGPPTASLPSFAVRARPRPARTLAAAAALGALTGMRSLSGPTVLASRALASGPQPGANRAELVLARPGTAIALAALALAEMAVDKTSWLPARIAPASLAGRAVIGAACGALQTRRRRAAAGRAALLGAAAAVTTARAAYAVRERTASRRRVPTALLGAVEDLVVIAAGAGLFWLLGRGEPPAGPLAA